MEAIISMIGILLNALSFGRMMQWSVSAYVVDVRYVHDEDEQSIPTLHIEARNTGKYGITLHPLEYRIIQKGQIPEKVRSTAMERAQRARGHTKSATGVRRTDNMPGAIAVGRPRGARP